MKNFTNNFKQFTSRLSARWLIMALMLLVGTSSAWADGFFEGLKVGYYPGTGDVDIWTGYNTSDIGTLSGQPYLKGVSVKTWQDNVTSVSIEIKNGNTTLLSATNATKISEWNNGNQVNWNKEWEILTNIALPKTSGAHTISVIAKTNFGTKVEYTLTYSIPCDNVDDSQIRIEIASATSYTKVYAWYDSNSELLGPWSGTAMTTNGTSDINGQTVKYITISRNSVSLNKSVNIIFNNGGSSQSSSITGLKWGNIYYFDKNGGNMESKCLEPACETPAAPNVTGTTNVVKCGNSVTTNGTITINNYVNTSTYKLQLGSNEAQTVTHTNGVFSVSESGTYKLTVTNDCGESSTKSDIVVGLTQNQVSISAISGPDNICSGSSADYSITAIDGVTYDWSINSDKFTLVGDNGTNSIQVKAIGTADATATLTVTATKNRCSTPQTKSINLIALPTITTESPTEGTVCSSTTISALEGTLSIDKSANSTTKWYKDGEEKSPTTTVETGEYTIKAVSNTGSCVSSTGVTYNVTEITTIPTDLVIDINGATTASICGGTAIINAKATGATRYTLYNGNGTAVETKEGDSNGVEFTVSAEDTYKFKATNNCGTTGYSSDVTLTVNPVPSAPSFTTEGETTCAEKPVNPALSNALGDGEYLVWYDASEGGTNLGSNLTSSAEDVTKIYYAAVSNGACESAERTPYTVDVEADPIVDLTLTLVDGKGNSLPLNYTYCQGDDVNVKLTYNGGIYWGEPEWNSTLTAGDMNTSGLRYDALNKKGEGTYTISNLQASGTLQVALTMCGDTKATSNVLNVNITPQAETPTVEVLLNIEKCGNDITQYGKIQISPYNAGYTYKINDTDVTPNNNGIVENLSTAGSFTLSAINSCKVSTPSAPFTISETDNKPTISISGNETAVLYEDVMLTATATDGATVKWYEGGEEKATGATYVVTSETATSKAVTAKAFLNGCESDEASHTVTFRAEDCGNIGSNNSIIITCDPGTYTGDLYCYIFGATTPKGWSECKGTKTNGIWKWEFNNINEGDHSLIFHSNSKSNGKDCKTGDLNHKLQRGYQYDYELNGVNSKWCNEPHPTIDPVSGKKLQTITAPAVKTVSVNSEQGSGVVNFVGRVIKTGCATGSAIWVGYQYKKANEEWPTTGVTAGSGEKQLVTITNNPGSEDFTVNVEGLGNGNYHFRAYIINGYNFTNGNYNQGVYYGLDKLVSVSTTKTPISNVTLNYCDEKGGKVGENPKPMCKGEFAYMKLDYQGSTASETKWLIDGEETTIVEETAVAGVYRFAISADVTISVKLRNDANLEQDGETPAYVTSSGLAYTMIDVPAAPYISINPASGVLCEGNTATITVTNPSPDCAYKLVGFTDYESGNLTYTVGSVAKYYVAAKHKLCPTNEYTSNQVAINQIIRTSANISIEPEEAETTPWEPVTITVKPDAGYIYKLSYTDGNLAAVDGVRIKQNGDSYTYYIPRPDSWGTGDATSARETVNYGIEAQLKVDGEESTCKLKAATAIIQLKDEDNENCPK